MKIIGVTGTNGKTTCVHLISSLLKNHFNCASFGTLGIKHYFNNQCVETKTTLTTLGSNELQQNLKKVLNLGCQCIAMEVSSHGIVQNRIAGIEFTDLIFTNLSRDHLDYHKTIDDYFNAKKQLFTKYCSKVKKAIINLDNYYGIKLIEFLQKQMKLSIIPMFDIVGFSVKSLSKIAALDLDLNSIKVITCENLYFNRSGINAYVKSPWGDGFLNTQLLGLHNLSNLLASIAATIPELTWSYILKKSISLASPIGRLQKVILKNIFFNITSNTLINIKHSEIFIDYAHTPDALEQTLLAIKNHYINAKICCIFGCGGDRDPSKRSEMLKCSEKYCNVIILTQDNSRSEDPNKIIENILSHKITNKSLKLLVEIDRKKAIHLAINEYYNDHVIIIAGKGHENEQIIGDRIEAFCDYTVATEALTNLVLMNRNANIIL